MEFIISLFICGFALAISFTFSRFLERYYIKEFLRENDIVEKTYDYALEICTDIIEKDNFYDIAINLTLYLLNYKGLNLKYSDIEKVINKPK